MNRTRIVISVFIALAFAMSTISAQGASKVSARKVKSLIKQLEKEHQASWEQMKQKMSASQEIWIQPENQDVECKVVSVVNDESGIQNVHNSKFYWDGQCKEGYAAGLGRTFQDSTSGLVAWLEEYGEPGTLPLNYYVHGYDLNITQIGFTDSAEPNPTNAWGAVYRLSETLESKSFAIVQSYFDPETGKTYSQSTNTSSDVVYSAVVFANNKGFLIITSLDPTEPTAHWGYLADENGNPNSYGIAVGRNGQVVHSEYKNGLRSDVRLPIELVEYFASLEKEIGAKMNLAQSKIQRGHLAVEVYKRRTCSGELNVDYIDNLMYGQICLEHGDFTPYMDKIVDLQKQAQERIERKTQIAVNQSQIDANRQIAAAQQQQAQQAQQAQQRENSAIARAQQQSQELYNNSKVDLYNFPMPEVGNFGGFGGSNSSQRNTSVCHVIGNIVTCN